MPPAPAPLSLAQLNATDAAEFERLLAGIYEHSPWIAERAATERPFISLAQLRQALVAQVRKAGSAQQLALIRAHPELAGKAMVARALTAASTDEQTRSGLTACSPAEFAQLQALNAAYNAKFGFPFILAVRGPRGTGLTRSEIIATFERRLAQPPEAEHAECLRQIHRIAEIRLDDRFGVRPAAGERVWDSAAALARHTEPPIVEPPGVEPPCVEQSQHNPTYLSPPYLSPPYLSPPYLSTPYLSTAHQAVAAELASLMREAGFDAVQIDAVGNVVGLYLANPLSSPQAPRLLTGSHYDTVRNAGRFDGRLGVLVAIEAVRALHQAGQRLPFAIELVAFAEEEGQRFPATFLASSALVGEFEPAWLAQTDAEGITLAEAMRQAGLPGELGPIHALARQRENYLGFVEVHIEQGPVLSELDLPLGVVSAINGSVRLLGEVIGVASHAGTTPMARRKDAATAVAELALYLERRASAETELVATMGQMEVPQGSINVVPGRCRFSLDIRAPSDAARDACLADVRAELAALCERRGLGLALREVMRAAAAPCESAWRQRWAAAVQALGLPLHTLPSGAGHDAMKLHRLLPQAMLFVRGQNGGISHNPLESVSSHDADLAVQAFEALLQALAQEHGA